MTVIIFAYSNSSNKCNTSGQVPPEHFLMGGNRLGSSVSPAQCWGSAALCFHSEPWNPSGSGVPQLPQGQELLCCPCCAVPPSLSPSLSLPLCPCLCPSFPVPIPVPLCPCVSLCPCLWKRVDWENGMNSFGVQIRGIFCSSSNRTFKSIFCL